MGEIEFGKCEVCGKEAPLRRTYFRYGIKCECHSPEHVELIRHCEECTPEEPKETKIIIKTDVLKRLALFEKMLNKTGHELLYGMPGGIEPSGIINEHFHIQPSSMIEGIIKDMDTPRRKVGFLAIDLKTNKSVHYGSADYPLRRVKGEK